MVKMLVLNLDTSINNQQLLHTLFDIKVTDMQEGKIIVIYDSSKFKYGEKIKLEIENI